jgi:hypothetical protein
MDFRSSSADFDMNFTDFQTPQHLAHARKQADDRGLDDVLIIDVDCHHYETDSLADILQFVEDPVYRQLAESGLQYRPHTRKWAGA